MGLAYWQIFRSIFNTTFLPDQFLQAATILLYRHEILSAWETVQSTDRMFFLLLINHCSVDKIERS